MKHLLIIIISCLSFSASAQFKIGVTAGINHASANDVLALSPERFLPKTSFNLGLAFDINIFKQLSIEPTILYSNKGWFIVDDIGNEIPTYLNYLSTHLLGKIHLDKNIKIITGFEIGYLLRSSSGEAGEPIIGELKKLDMGVITGVAFTFFDIISFHMKYNFGINKILDLDYINRFDVHTGTFEIKNSNLMAGLTVYPFKIDKH